MERLHLNSIFFSAHSLGVGLLQQGAPELISLSRLGEDQLVVESGDAVINDDVHPVSITPELKGNRRND